MPQSASAGSFAVETSSWGQQREQSVGRVAGIIYDPQGFPYIPPGVDVLEGYPLTQDHTNLYSNHLHLPVINQASYKVMLHSVTDGPVYFSPS